MFPILVSSWFHQIRIVQQGQIEKREMLSRGFAFLAAHTEERCFDMQTATRKSVNGKGTVEISLEKKIKYKAV